MRSLTPHEVCLQQRSLMDILWKRSYRNDHHQSTMKRWELVIVLRKKKMKFYAEQRRNIQTPVIHQGDRVLMKNLTKPGRLQPKFHKEPYQVVKCKGPMVIIKRGEEVKARNGSHLRKLVTKEDPLTAEETGPPDAPCATSDDIPGAVANGYPDSGGTQTPDTGPTYQNNKTISQHSPDQNTQPTYTSQWLWDFVSLGVRGWASVRIWL